MDVNPDSRKRSTGFFFKLKRRHVLQIGSGFVVATWLDAEVLGSVSRPDRFGAS